MYFTTDTTVRAVTEAAKPAEQMTVLEIGALSFWIYFYIFSVAFIVYFLSCRESFHSLVANGLIWLWSKADEEEQGVEDEFEDEANARFAYLERVIEMNLHEIRELNNRLDNDLANSCDASTQTSLDA